MLLLLSLLLAPSVAGAQQPPPATPSFEALCPTADWFKVDYRGVQGWISAGHVTPFGDCA